MNKKYLAGAVVFICTGLLKAGVVDAMDVIFPSGLSAFYAHQNIELAVSGVPAGESAELTLAPVTPAPSDSAQEGESNIGVMPEPVRFTVEGDGTTKLLMLPGNALAPANYEIREGENVLAEFSVVSGIWPSTFHVSQTGRQDAWKNFSVDVALNFGSTHPKDSTRPTDTPRAQSSVTMRKLNDRIALNIPSIIYVYWTGYLTHKPWGIHKEWVSPDVIEMQRTFNYHIAQRMRRFDHLITSIGGIDEPGLPWGRTASGSSASGFSNWNVQDWIEEQGGVFSMDPGSLPDEEYRTYMQLRAQMLRSRFQQANDDIKSVWPTSLFAQDSYAPHAVGDGTDPMNQTANDIPTTHVFGDYGFGKFGVLAHMYLEKAHDPLSRIAHAMNGQLFGFATPTYDKNQLYAYHLMMNVMLASGLESNWWLNWWRLGTTEDGTRDHELAVERSRIVNEPAAKLGPLFKQMEPSGHNVAILWSNTEIWMRTKGVMQVEASEGDGEQKALLVADLPEDAVDEDGNLKYNAYLVGGNYKNELITAFSAINRAGYPLHFLHEDLIPAGKLENYDVLVMIHQTFPLPEEKHNALEDWIAGGGTLLLDESSTVEIAGATRFRAESVVDQGHAWRKTFNGLYTTNKVDDLKTTSYHISNYQMESYSRNARSAFLDVLKATGAKRVLDTDSVHLGIERHLGGAAELLMVINTYEELPEIEEGEMYPVYNYAPYEASYRLPTLDEGRTVYLIEGLDWRNVSRVDDPTAEQHVTFEPGEMKLYFAVPSEPTGLDLSCSLEEGELAVSAQLDGGAAPWPLELELLDPTGRVILTLNRAMSADGRYEETLPLGLNAPEGAYTVRLSSPVAELSAAQTITHLVESPEIVRMDDAVRVFDREAIRDHLAKGPELVIALADDGQQAVADKLASALTSQGLKVSIRPEAEVWTKALYPQVWDPYAPVFQKTAEDTPLPEVRTLDKKGRPVRDDKNQFIMIPGKVRNHLIIESEYYESPTVTTMDGEPFIWALKRQGNLLTVGPKGYVQIGGVETFYEPGTKLFYVDNRRFVTVNGEKTSVKTDDAFRARWARPWRKITGHPGGNNLTPQLPEVYKSEHHLILLGDSRAGTLVPALQASELLLQVVDEQYPGPGKALIQYAWSPFSLGKDVIYIGATDNEGLMKGAEVLVEMIEE